MASQRRMGVESSETRADLIEAARQIVNTEGTAAVTARRLAEKLGLSRHSVHYYFGTIEDLFVAMIRCDGDTIRGRLTQVLQSDEPLRVVWELASHSMAASLEFSAMALRSEAIRIEVNRYLVELRRMAAEALRRHLRQRGIEPTVSPMVTTVVVTCISQTLAFEKALGVTEAHAETRALLEEWLESFADRGEWFTRTSRPKQPTGSFRQVRKHTHPKRRETTLKGVPGKRRR